MRVLVTGSRGFLGALVMERLWDRGYNIEECDIQEDVLSPRWKTTADAAIHLAADKYAVNGESRPWPVTELNVRGTIRVTDMVPRVVLASTCKAASPITCYGASKLIAERVTLNAGGVVVRLVNVLGSAGSVTEIWDEVPEGEPLPVTDCTRLFITPDQAAAALMDALDAPSGRYRPKGTKAMHMLDLAEELYPGRPTVKVPLRRGDRPAERLTNEYERLGPGPDGSSLVRIYDAWEEQ